MKITRRNLLKHTFMLPFVAVSGAVLSAAPSQKQPATRRYRLNRFSIAGFQYYEGPARGHGLKPGEKLKLTREPQNPHDPFGVEIHRGKAKLGYVPRSDKKHISRLLEQGARLECRVIELDLEAGVCNMVKVEVRMA